MAEGARLESVYTQVSRVRIPPSPPNTKKPGLSGLFCICDKRQDPRQTPVRAGAGNACGDNQQLVEHQLFMATRRVSAWREYHARRAAIPTTPQSPHKLHTAFWTKLHRSEPRRGINRPKTVISLSLPHHHFPFRGNLKSPTLENTGPEPASFRTPSGAAPSGLEHAADSAVKSEFEAMENKLGHVPIWSQPPARRRNLRCCVLSTALKNVPTWTGIASGTT